MYQQLTKPLFDILISAIVLVILSPFLLALTILIAFVNKDNPFFTQDRPGKNEKIFKLIKFKTMNDDRDNEGKLKPDAQRLTRLGKIMRRTSLDEFPQLFNVIKGDMSFIGPRPLLVEYLPLYTDFQKQRHLVKPGISGWAQVNGRNNISWERKFELDVWYVHNISLILDVKIFLLTIKKVIQRKDINTQGVATTQKFTGN